MKEKLIRKQLLILVLTVLIPCVSNGQYRDFSSENEDSLNTAKVKNGVYVELLGTGGLYSINYERIVNDNFVLRGGVSVLPKISLGLAGQIGPGFTLPISSTFLLPTKRNGSFIELGFGGAFLMSNKSFDFSMGPIIGFREQDLIKGGSFIRLSFIPTYFFISDEFLATGGISIGYSF